MLKVIACKVLPDGLQQALRRWFRGSRDVPISDGYEVIDGEVPPKLLQGWQDFAVAERQYLAFTPLLRKMYEGNPREDFVAVATAVQMTGLENPLIIEVGCGSGWNAKVLAHLLKRPVRYIGLDYSLAMTALGKRCYPNTQFVVGDATTLPLRDSACDILLSGGVLMHLLGYQKAIRESVRVTRRWCIFHTVPVLQHRETAVLCKRAYGQLTIEIIFNEGELHYLLEQSGMVVRYLLDNIPYNLASILGEPTVTKTYVCEVTE